MKATGKLLTFALPLFIVALLGGPQQTHARYAEQALKSDQTEFGNQLEGQDPAMEIRERQVSSEGGNVVVIPKRKLFRE
ncbi:hypothetical protein LSH36_820g00034 [Paralvinella palmiformis]|uniref:Uncharacterized protein n=1 Tax=Paralvinella palmiformis TaxID=53620 RepID=A0AAD9IZA9_9ANNE|nr:hypothetical protein LSH36_820g00034 [Paralvinella palmiformis]